MSLKILMGGGLGDDSPPESDEMSDKGDDDTAMAELAAKYMQRFGEALDGKDWPSAYKAFCRLNELHSYEETQERGY